MEEAVAAAAKSGDTTALLRETYRSFLHLYSNLRKSIRLERIVSLPFFRLPFFAPNSLMSALQFRSASPRSAAKQSLLRGTGAAPQGLGRRCGSCWAAGGVLGTGWVQPSKQIVKARAL